MAYSLAARDMGPRWLLGAPSAEGTRAVRPPSDDEAVLASELEATSRLVAPEVRGRLGFVALALLAVLGSSACPVRFRRCSSNAIGMVLIVDLHHRLAPLHPTLERSGSLAIRMPGWPWLP